MTRCNDQSWPAIDFRSHTGLLGSHMLFPSTYRMTQLVRPWTWHSLIFFTGLHFYRWADGHWNHCSKQSLRDFRASAELNSRHYFLIIQVAISRLGRVVESWKMPTFLCFPVAWETDETGSQGPLTCPEVHHTFISRSSHTLLVQKGVAAVSQKCWELANHPAIIPKRVIKPSLTQGLHEESSLRAGPLLQLPVSSSPRIQRISYENEAKTQNVALNTGWHIFGWDLLKSIKLCLSPHLSFWLHCISHHHVYDDSLQILSMILCTFPWGKELSE